ncbi:MAG TPA: hypothetical protein VM075_00660 [Anaerolineae bacterium]|nr:hypothetical protein [Anaerolineae bacterium]
MELAWQLKGYAISIKVLRKREALSKAEPVEERIVEPSRTHHRSEKAHEDLLHASGSRYVGPMR